MAAAAFALGSSAILTILVVTCCWNPSLCQDSLLGLGPGDCLIDRIDVIRCTRFPRTLRPGPNQYGIFQTVFRISGPNSAGLPACRIRPRNQQIRDIRTIGIANPVMIIFSPGATIAERYGNQQYVEYNVQCGGNRLAFFNITSIDMQEKTCANPNLNNELQCVDYIRVQRGGFGVTESCGKDASDNTEQLEQGSLQIIFRTSIDRRFNGFSGTVICFDPDTADEPGCTRPLGDNSTASEEMAGNSRRRRKRDLEMFHAQWQRRLAYVQRMKRQAGGGGMFRFQKIDVPFGINVTFSNGKLEFIDTIDESVQTENTIERILILQTFDANGDIDFFKDEAANDDGVLIPLPGPGPLIVVGRHAYFQLFVIDPRGLVPNTEEMMVISNLAEDQLAVTREDESERLPQEFLEPPTPDPNELNLPRFPQRRRRRQAGMITGFQNDTILVALENENACNPVLRASAAATIESADPAIVAELRRYLDRKNNAATTATPL